MLGAYFVYKEFGNVNRYDKLIDWLCYKYSILHKLEIRHQKSIKVRYRKRNYITRIVNKKKSYVFRLPDFDKLTFISDEDKHKLVISEFIRFFLISAVYKKIKNENLLRKVIMNNTEKLYYLYNKEVLAGGKV